MLSETQRKQVLWSYSGIILTILMGIVCPVSLFAYSFFWCGLNPLSPMVAALLGMATAVGGMAVLWLVSTRTRGWVGIALRAFVAIAVVVTAADVIMMLVFSCRFNLRDALVFGGHLGTWFRFLDVGMTHPTSRTILASLVALWTLASLPAFIWIPVRVKSDRFFVLGLVGAGLILLAGMIETPLGADHRAFVCSVWELALRDTSARTYSDAFKRSVAETVRRSRPSVVCDVPRADGQRPDIVMLVLESWSSYHSKYFGGNRDWTPQLDLVAARSLAFTNCIANGLITEHGLIALLAGEEPFSPSGIPQRGKWECFSGFHGAERSLPRLLAHSGYISYYLTTGPLAFSCKHQFLDSIGFDFLSDIGDAFYKNGKPGGEPWPESVFGPPDQALYLRTLALLDEIRAQRSSGGVAHPLLLVLETTSSHVPFMCPDGPPHTEERVMRYVDREAAGFIHSLDAGGFFCAGGLLLVISDHRAMTPLGPDEVALFGESAQWRIPLFFNAGFLGGGRRDGHMVSQADIAPTLEWLVTGSAPVAGRRGLLLCPEVIGGRFQAARLPASFGSVVAWDTLKGVAGTIRWNGDNSSASKGLEDALPWLTWERMGRERAVGVIPDRNAPLQRANWIR